VISVETVHREVDPCILQPDLVGRKLLGCVPGIVITAAVEGWARAWSSKDVKGYLGYYAPDFEVPGGESRAAWEKQREERITRPKSIEVEAKVLNAQVSGNEATVTIRQAYKSDTLKTNSTKTLKLVKSGERWLIKQERVGG